MKQEEKAKAYDEALEKARMYHDNAKAVGEYAMVARYENIFPELAESESEDEKIYREIYSIVHHSYQEKIDNLVSQERKKELLDKWEKAKDWLEKQKEQKLQDTVGRVSIEVRSNLQTDEIVRKTLIMLVNDNRILVKGSITNSDILNWLKGKL